MSLNADLARMERRGNKLDARSKPTRDAAAQRLALILRDKAAKRRRKEKK